MNNYQKQCAYLAQLNAFKEYMEACFDVLMGDGETDASVDLFYQSDFTITFRGKSVTLHNGAEVWNAIEDAIQTEIDNEEA